MSKSSELTEILNNSEGLLIVSLLDSIYTLSNSKIPFKEPVKGIYKRNSYVVSLELNKTYYKDLNYTPFYFKEFSSVLDLNNLNLQDNENICDKDFNIIISSYELANKEKYLTLEPYFNPNILFFIKDYLYNIILENMKYKKYLNEKPLDIYFNSFDQESKDTIDLLLDSLSITVLEFANQNKWSIYDLSLLGTDMLVRRIIDYRIYKYTLDNLDAQ